MTLDHMPTVQRAWLGKCCRKACEMAVWIVRLVGPMPAARCKTKRDLQRKAKRSWTVRRTMRQGVQDDSSQPQHTSAQQHALHSSIAPGQCCATFLFGQVGGRRKGGIFGNRQFWARAFLAGLSASFFEMRKKATGSRAVKLCSRRHARLEPPFRLRSCRRFSHRILASPRL